MTTKSQSQKRREGGYAAAAAAEGLDIARSDWRQALRTRVVQLGIQAIWGKSAFSAELSAGVPLISTGLRLAWLKAQDSAEVSAREPGGGVVKPIEDAPGSYVKVRS